MLRHIAILARQTIILCRLHRRRPTPRNTDRILQRLLQIHLHLSAQIRRYTHIPSSNPRQPLRPEPAPPRGPRPPARKPHCDDQIVMLPAIAPVPANLGVIVTAVIRPASPAPRSSSTAGAPTPVASTTSRAPRSSAGCRIIPHTRSTTLVYAVPKAIRSRCLTNRVARATAMCGLPISRSTTATAVKSFRCPKSNPTKNIPASDKPSPKA